MYGKWFASTFTGSMMGAGPVVISVWSYVIAHAVDGAVELNPALIAVMIGEVNAVQVASAIERLCAVDEQSRSDAEDGRRLIREGQFQYRVVNHGLYRDIRDQKERREYNRLKQRESRERRASTTSNRMSKMSTPSANTEADTHTDEDLTTTTADLSKQVGEPPAPVVTKSKPPQFHADTDTALEMLNACRKTAAEVNSKKGVRAIKGKAIKQAISARLNEGCGLDGVERVLSWHLHEDWKFREGLDSWKTTPPVEHLLKATGVFREGNFNKRLAAGDVPAPGEEHRAPLDVSGYSPLTGDEDYSGNYGPQEM